MSGLPPLKDILEEYNFLDDRDDRTRLLVELGRQLEPMPQALKTDATKVQGCQAAVWAYPTVNEGRLHFLADSTSALTKGIIALVLSVVQDKPAAEIAVTDVTAALEPFQLQKHLTSKRTSGVPNMITLVKQTAERYASAA